MPKNKLFGVFYVKFPNFFIYEENLSPFFQNSFFTFTFYQPQSIQRMGPSIFSFLSQMKAIFGIRVCHICPRGLIFREIAKGEVFMSHKNAKKSKGWGIKFRQSSGKTRVKISYFDAKTLEETEVKEPEEIKKYLEKPGVTWINVVGLSDSKLIRKIGEILNLHPLALKDIFTRGQRPKLQNYGDYYLVVARIFHEEKTLYGEQISVIYGQNYVATFQEMEEDVFDPIREEIRQEKSILRKKGADYLLYRLLDATVEHTFPILENLGESLELLEDRIIAKPTRHSIREVHNFRRKLLLLRRAFWPMREVMDQLARAESGLKKDTRPYFRDLYERTIQGIEMVETLRDITSEVLDIYLSNLSYRTNEVMKVLTVVATIFIPLTFITGVYGMNFNTHISPWNMPELNWYYGYPITITLMIVVAGGMLYYFKKKNWV